MGVWVLQCAQETGENSWVFGCYSAPKRLRRTVGCLGVTERPRDWGEQLGVWVLQCAQETEENGWVFGCYSAPKRLRRTVGCLGVTVRPRD